MKKEIKNFGKITEIILVILTFSSLIINALYLTNYIQSLQGEIMILNLQAINSFCENSLFNIILWSNNILIYFVLIFYIIDTIKTKKNMFLKFSFALFSFFTTLIVMFGIMNFISDIFGVFN